MSISSAVLNFFSRRDPKRDAAVALARVISRSRMEMMPFEQHLREGQRLSEEHRMPLGIWLFPIMESESNCRFVPEHGIPAVTCNLRSFGIGALTIMPLQQDRFLVAIPDQDSNSDSLKWLFFDCEVRHNTKLPGGWYQLGMQLGRIADLDSDDRRRFRESIQSVCKQRDAMA